MPVAKLTPRYGDHFVETALIVKAGDFQSPAFCISENDLGAQWVRCGIHF